VSALRRRSRSGSGPRSAWERARPYGTPWATGRKAPRGRGRGGRALARGREWWGFAIAPGGKRSAPAGFGATLGAVSPSLAADLASILKREHGPLAASLEARLLGETQVPSVAELVELGARAERRGATDAELVLAVGMLLALHAPPAGAVFR
jgi:hypothetical protein